MAKEKKEYLKENYVKRLSEGKKTYEKRKSFLQEFSLTPEIESADGETSNADASSGSSGDYMVSAQSGKYHSSNKYLTTDEMKTNAAYIYKVLSGKGWTKQAIAGMLGNMQTESTINPGLWQSMRENDMHMGFGLVQWTPASKYINWAKGKGLDYKSLDTNISRILWEVENKQQWINKSMSFKQFTQSTDSAYNLGLKFLSSYERPANPNQPKRGTQAETWYKFLSGLGSSDTAAATAKSLSEETKSIGDSTIYTGPTAEEKQLLNQAKYSYEVPLGKMKSSTFIAPKYIRNQYVADRKQSQSFVEKVDYAPLPSNEFIHMGSPSENYYSSEARELFMYLKDRLGYDQLVVSRGYEPESGDNSSHSVGIAMDVYVATPDEAIRIADMAWLLGIRSIAIGPKFVHVDAGPEAVWGYENLAVYRGPGSVKVSGIQHGF